jgi:hypothetical protein
VLRAREEDIASQVSKIALDTYPDWICGLLQASVDGYVGGSLRFATAAPEADPDQNNVKYGFACYAKRRSCGSLSRAELDETTLRKTDESSAAIRHLLSPDFDAASLPNNPYYMWVYLKHAMLRLSYLDWNDQIHRASRAATFDRRTSPDPEPILHAAE